MFDRQDLIRAYLGAQKRGYGGYYAESPTFNAALAAYYSSLLDGLQQLFGLRLNGRDLGGVPRPSLLMLFRSTAESLLTLRTPWSGFLEAGLIHRDLDEAGEPGARVHQAGERIGAAIDEARAGHLEMLDALLVTLLAERADSVFTEDDARAAGIEFLPRPNTTEYPLFDR